MHATRRPCRAQQELAASDACSWRATCIQTRPRAACPRARSGAAPRELPHAHTHAVCGKPVTSRARASAAGRAIAPELPLGDCHRCQRHSCPDLAPFLAPPAGTARAPSGTRQCKATSEIAWEGPGVPGRPGPRPRGDDRPLAGRRPGLEKRIPRRAPRLIRHPTKPQGRPRPPSREFPLAHTQGSPS